MLFSLFFVADVLMLLLFLSQSLTKELAEELEYLRMQAVLPSLTSFSRSLMSDIRERMKQKQQQQSVDDDDDIEIVAAAPSSLFPLQQEFMRLLPRRSVSYKTSSYHHYDLRVMEMLQQVEDSGALATFVSLTSSVHAPANIFVHASSSSSCLYFSAISQLFFKTNYNMPLITVCGHLGPRKSSSQSALQYLRCVVFLFMSIIISTSITIRCYINTFTALLAYSSFHFLS
jgi:hypothetical protein